MSSKVELPPAHKRSLSVVARSIEDSLNDIATRLQGNLADSLLHRIEHSYTDQERKQIFKAVEGVREALVELILEFDLDTSTVFESQILSAHCSHIWTLLQDSRSDKLKSYGEVPEESRASIDTAIDKMLDRMGQLQNVSAKHEQ